MRWFNRKPREERPGQPAPEEMTPQSTPAEQLMRDVWTSPDLSFSITQTEALHAYHLFAHAEVRLRAERPDLAQTIGGERLRKFRGGMMVGCISMSRGRFSLAEAQEMVQRAPMVDEVALTMVDFFDAHPGLFPECRHA